MTDRTYMDVEDLEVYRRLCQLPFRMRYKECIRMLNGLEKTLECKLPAADRRWQVAEDPSLYGQPCELDPSGWPTPNPDT